MIKAGSSTRVHVGRRVEVHIDPFMATKMYRQRAKNSNFSDFDDTWQSSEFFSIGHEMGSTCKNYRKSARLSFPGHKWVKRLAKDSVPPVRPCFKLRTYSVGLVNPRVPTNLS